MALPEGKPHLSLPYLALGSSRAIPSLALLSAALLGVVVVGRATPASAEAAARATPWNSGLAVDTACEGDSHSNYIQMKSVAISSRAAVQNATNATSPHVATAAPEPVTVPAEVRSLFIVWCVLTVLAAVQRSRYMHVAEEAEEQLEHFKILSRSDASIALANESDELSKTNRNANLGIAVRSTIFIMFASLPVVVAPIRDWFQMMTYDTTYTAVLIMWTIDRTVGRTVANVWDAILGTVISFFFMFFISGFYPGGVHEGGGVENAHKWWIGLCYFLLTTLGMMFLNFSNGTRIWCLSYHMGNMMYFLKPKPTDAVPIFSENFEINVKGQMFGYCLITTLACGLSIVSLSLPTPMASHRLALEKIDETKRMFCTLVRSMMRIYTAEEVDDARNVFSRLLMYSKLLESKLQQMAIDAEYAWWEHFDLGSFKDVRYYLGQHVAMLQRLLIGVKSLQDALGKESRTSPELREKLMAEIKGPLSSLENSVLQLFDNVCDGTKDGRVDEEEAAMMLTLVATVEADLLKLSDCFRSTCSKLTDGSFAARNEALKDEYRMVFLMCNMCRFVVDLAKKLARRDPIPRPSCLESLKGFFSRNWGDLTGKQHLDFAMRNSISVLLCFFFGYWGSGSLIPPYTADIATNASLLLSSYVGSAMQKNMGRVQGLVIGSVIGKFFHSLASQLGCGAQASGVARMAILGAFSNFSMYIYMASPTFGSTASLFGGFGSMLILQPCSSFESTSSEYLKVTCATLCIIIMAGVDMAMAPSAADDATSAFLSFLRLNREVMRSMLQGTPPPPGHDPEAMLAKLDSTELCAGEASKAPSLGMRTFREALYTDMVAIGKQSWIHVEGAKWSLLKTPSEDSKGGSGKYWDGSSGAIEVLRTCKSYDGLVDAIEEVLLDAFLLTELSMKSKTSLDAIHGARDVHMRVADTRKMLADIITEEIKIPETGGKTGEKPSLEEDLDTALQVLTCELDSTISVAGEVKRLAMTHV